MSKNNVLIVAPHADDEILGCGATIAKYVEENNDVYVVVLTNANLGDKKRFTASYIKKVRKECKSSNNFLGVKKVIFKNLPAPKLDQFPLYKIADTLKEIIEKYKINILFVPHYGDLHIDHQLVFEASIIASRPVDNVKVKKILSYETLSETEWGLPLKFKRFQPNYFNIINSNQLNKKLKAFKFYISQLKSKNHPRTIDSIKSLAQYRGSIVGYEYCEAFNIIRINE